MDLFNKLEEAKKAVKSCLESGDTRVGMKGLVYWAEEVERLRNEIKSKL